MLMLHRSSALRMGKARVFSLRATPSTPSTPSIPSTPSTPTSAPPAWPVNRVRGEFVDYFQSHQHVNVKSSPCVPVNDPTLLFANAGMNQFKSIFQGTVDPSSPLAALSRAGSQKPY
ncbi:tRNA synthetases class II (A)-domain-containing protein [Ochromonadaceae sp. CCMP2298]|nr:tRNA synthetases class II (A)-domain-containing protein [Ochromonadaceae sp. CCMP2298]